MNPTSLYALYQTAKSNRPLSNAVSSTGGKILDTISSVSPRAGGIAGNVVDKVGAALGNPFPEGGATEKAQSAGGYDQWSKAMASGDMNKAAQLETKAQNTAGFNSANASYVEKASAAQSGGINPNQVSNLLDQRSMGASVGDVRDFGGQKWRWSGSEWTKEGGDQHTSGVDIQGALDSAGGGIAKNYLDQSSFDSVLNEWQQRGGDLANMIEQKARENAERRYKDVLSALNVQKEETYRTAEQQRGRAKEQKQMVEEGLIDKEQSETKKIESEREGFKREVQDNREQLASNWRDLSLEVQRAMRARGVSDSSYSASAEQKILLDFNKGLRQIAVQSQGALKDFSDAIEETTKFYTRQRAQLDFDLKTQLDDIDTWVRQKVQSIQAQENVALSDKFSQIDDAIIRAETLRTNVEQQIAQQKISMGMWLTQMQMSYESAVATAANGKTSDAITKINDVRNLFKSTSDILANGGSMVYDNKTKQAYVYGKNPLTGEDVYAPVTTQWMQQQVQDETDDRYKQIYGSSNFNQKRYDELLNQNLQSVGFPVQQPQQQETGGLLNSIRSMFK